MVLACCVSAVLAVIAAYSFRRLRKYPLEKGIRLLALVGIGPAAMRLPLMRIGNRFLLNIPVPKPFADQEIIEFCCTAPDGCSVKMIACRPAGRGSCPCLLYLHGGGFFSEAAPYHYTNLWEYAENTGCMAVMVRYRTSDRHPFPAPFADCAAALGYIHSHSDELGIDRGRIVIGGDSAGGCLAASLSIWAREHRIHLCGQMLVYPVLDASLSTASALAMTDSPLWNSRLSRRMWDIYLRGGDGGFPPSLVSPFSCTDFSGLPPSYIETAEHDSLRDEGNIYARRLSEAGVDVLLNEVRGACHGYDGLRHAGISRNAVRQRSEALKNFFYG